jgi:hypothetical protein
VALLCALDVHQLQSMGLKHRASCVTERVHVLHAWGDSAMLHAAWEFSL